MAQAGVGPGGAEAVRGQEGYDGIGGQSARARGRLDLWQPLHCARPWREPHVKDVLFPLLAGLSSLLLLFKFLHGLKKPVRVPSAGPVASSRQPPLRQGGRLPQQGGCAPGGPAWPRVPALPAGWQTHFPLKGKFLFQKVE